VSSGDGDGDKAENEESARRSPVRVAQNGCLWRGRDPGSHAFHANFSQCVSSPPPRLLPLLVPSTLLCIHLARPHHPLINRIVHLVFPVRLPVPYSVTALSTGEARFVAGDIPELDPPNSRYLLSARLFLPSDQDVHLHSQSYNSRRCRLTNFALSLARSLLFFPISASSEQKEKGGGLRLSHTAWGLDLALLGKLQDHLTVSSCIPCTTAANRSPCGQSKGAFLCPPRHSTYSGHNRTGQRTIAEIPPETNLLSPTVARQQPCCTKNFPFASPTPSPFVLRPFRET
jgi:hypothetical protein